MYKKGLTNTQWIILGVVIFLLIVFIIAVNYNTLFKSNSQLKGQLKTLAPTLSALEGACLSDLIECIKQTDTDYNQCVIDTGNEPFCESSRELGLRICIDDFLKCRKEGIPI